MAAWQEEAILNTAVSEGRTGKVGVRKRYLIRK